MLPHPQSDVLSETQIAGFIRDGFVRIDRAFPSELAEQGRAIMWRDIPFDPDDPRRGPGRSCGFPAMEAGLSRPR